MITTINEFKKHLKIRSINEGQFSWFTQDRHTQIGNMVENRIPVYMFDNKGNFWFEDNYKGYGKFGGKDYFDLVAEMNGYTLEDVEALGKHDLRSIGIDLAYNKMEPKNGGEMLFPALVENPQFDWKNHDFTEAPKDDPNQGSFMDELSDEPYEWEDDYEDDYEDYEDLEESKINEKLSDSEKAKAMWDKIKPAVEKKYLKVKEYATKCAKYGSIEIRMPRFNINDNEVFIYRNDDRIFRHPDEYGTRGEKATQSTAYHKFENMLEQLITFIEDKMKKFGTSVDVSA